MAEDGRVPAKTSSADEVTAFLAKAAALPVAPGRLERRGRLIFAMDATASREPTWDQACHIQGEMFEATAALGGLDIQLVYYRGFHECRASGWVRSAEQLLALMRAVGCHAGQTQISRVLTHAAKEARQKKVDALIFVGDCMEENLDPLAHLAGELGLLGVPIFIFHERADGPARRAFETLARLSGGACCPFDAGAARQLRDLLGAVAVYAAGGRAALEDFARVRGETVRRLTSRLASPPPSGGG